MKRRPAFLRFTTLAALMMSTSCVRKYEPPTPDQPHSILKFRRRYHEPVGTDLVEVLKVDGRRAYKEVTMSSRAHVPRTDAVLVEPVPAQVEMIATFTHTSTTTVQESYECGTTGASRTCYRSVQRTNTVTDGHCKKKLAVPFKEGSAYLLELDYQDSRHCVAHCYEQRPIGDGKFSNDVCSALLEY